MGTTYFFAYFLIPKYVFRSNYKLFIIYGIFAIVFSTYGILLTIFGNFIFLTNLKVTNVPPMSRNYIFVLILVYLVVGLVSFIRVLKKNSETIAKNVRLENKLLEGNLRLKDQELQYLKKQIHPHFLFNTLNTIYGFAIARSEHTPELILKLSNLLDYILYQVQKPLVPLQEELAHIEEYISLEQIRFKDTLQVTFKKELKSKNLQIPPMLFIPFIENAFKHGTILLGTLEIAIQIQASEETIFFEVTNTASKLNSNTNPIGLGLQNIEKRLQLLYKNNFTLVSEQTKNSYSIKLTIHL
ncbi:sensor histidine kinase [Cochleicola gelatinilyticus]|nr:histidine kinase [Cochleicola gelatinilyticus]